jgi:hypothetical protein
MEGLNPLADPTIGICVSTYIQFQLFLTTLSSDFAFFYKKSMRFFGKGLGIYGKRSAPPEQGRRLLDAPFNPVSGEIAADSP